MKIKRIYTGLVMILLVGIMLASFAINTSAQGNILSVNSGDGFSTWFISGEQTMVINGFDLRSYGLSLPVTIDAVRISVNTPVPGAPVVAVVYQDANGGSPVDAQLVASKTVTIDQAGVARVQLDAPAIIEAPVAWVGFYLPVDFQFYGDTSGSSVLSYWAWSPDGGFNLSELSTALVVGPADGTAPVNIDMGGKARITAEIRQVPVNPAEAVAESTDAVAPETTVDPESTAEATQSVNVISAGVSDQLVTSTDGNLLDSYEDCAEVLYDPLDIRVTGRGGFYMYCRNNVTQASTGQVVGGDGRNYERTSYLYEVNAAGDYKADENDAERLKVAVTHCMIVAPEDVDRAKIGIAYGSPRTWRILDTTVFGNVACAEVTHSGNIALFLRRTGAENYRNVNLTFAGEPTLSPLPLRCGVTTEIFVSVVNDGFESTISPVIIGVEQITFLEDGAEYLAQVQTYEIPVLDPGESFDFTTSDISFASFPGLDNEIRFLIDYENEIPEINESDNAVFRQSTMIRDKNVICPDFPTLTPLPTKTITPTPTPTPLPAEFAFVQVHNSQINAKNELILELEMRCSGQQKCLNPSFQVISHVNGLDQRPYLLPPIINFTTAGVDTVVQLVSPNANNVLRYALQRFQGQSFINSSSVHRFTMAFELRDTVDPGDVIDIEIILHSSNDINPNNNEAPPIQVVVP